MKYIPLATALLMFTSAAAFAQTQSSDTADTPAVATPDTNNPSAPVEGENSFTEDQARSRIQDAGYTDVKDLKLDDKGFWNASAMKGQSQVKVVLDYQGNVVVADK